MALIGLLGLALTAFVLRETRPEEDRIAIDFGSVARGYLALLGDRYFLGVVFIGGFGMSSFFAFLAGSSFVYIDHFGLTPTQYSLGFAVNAVAFIGSGAGDRVDRPAHRPQDHGERGTHVLPSADADAAWR